MSTHTYRFFKISTVAAWTARRVRGIHRPHHLCASAIRHHVPVSCTIFIILNFSASVSGRQYDRMGAVWVGNCTNWRLMGMDCSDLRRKNLRKTNSWLLGMCDEIYLIMRRYSTQIRILPSWLRLTTSGITNTLESSTCRLIYHSTLILGIRNCWHCFAIISL